MKKDGEVAGWPVGGACHHDELGLAWASETFLRRRCLPD